MTNKRGLTLIEVVVAMAVFMIIVTMYWELQQFSLQGVKLLLGLSTL